MFGFIGSFLAKHIAVDLIQAEMQKLRDRALADIKMGIREEIKTLVDQAVKDYMDSKAPKIPAIPSTVLPGQ